MNVFFLIYFPNRPFQKELVRSTLVTNYLPDLNTIIWKDVSPARIITGSTNP
ncbi:hypothetical protein LV84_01182 [Algoriphagus ratkowskyi]|uniref:Uncharacterized protein n=1 Tax=Algoriphagus ratkowskyi TaxID=57028 RepID=A0A2W7RJG7_9BACT|nr:hypothetical protein LV84_01182 [Algoriphagus ratkowskyi]